MTRIEPPVIVRTGYFDADEVPAFRIPGITPDREVVQYEIELPSEEGGTHFLNGVKEPIMPDTLLLAKEGDRRHTILPYKNLFVHIKAGGLIGETLDAASGFIRLSDPERIRCLLADIAAKSTRSDAGIELMIQSRIYELVWRISEEKRLSGEYDGIKSEVIAGALRYIDAGIGRNITLEELAESQHISPVYFHRLFKKKLGVTPYRYMLTKKLAAAKERLAMTGDSCLDIAMSLGFSSQSYFNYTFRKEVGMNPSEYRREWRSRYPDRG